MSGMLWTKFYFPDWTNDPGLRASSLAARGLWMDMLCIAARHDPPGYVAINGQPADVDMLARMVGASPHDVEILIGELERNGVFSRNRTGMIYSRRMVRDMKRSQINAKNGQKGGMLSLGKTREISGSLKPPLEPSLKRPPSISQDTSIPEEEEKPSVSCPKPSRVRTDYPEEFQKFWSGYPTDSLMSKKEALSAWKRLDDDARAQVLASLPAFRAYCTGHPDYRPVHAVRYLSQRRFEGFGAIAAKISSTVFVEQGSAAWQAWQRVKPTPTTKADDGRQGWWFPSELPGPVQVPLSAA